MILNKIFLIFEKAVMSKAQLDMQYILYYNKLLINILICLKNYILIIGIYIRT